MSNIFFYLMSASQSDADSCSAILGTNLTNFVENAIDAFQIVSAIVAVVVCTMKLFPAITSKDADALNKAKSSCINVGIALAIICVLPAIIRLVGVIFGFDLSCF